MCFFCVVDEYYNSLVDLASWAPELNLHMVQEREIFVLSKNREQRLKRRTREQRLVCGQRTVLELCIENKGCLIREYGTV